MGRIPRIRLLCVLALAAPLAACTLDSPKRRYLLADRLWVEKKFEASAAEFEKLATRDPNGELGLAALYQAAVIQTTNLGRHQRAIDNLRKYVQSVPDPDRAWTAKMLISEILFEKLEDYSETLTLAKAMLAERPNDPRAPQLRYRIGRALFFQNRFPEAREAFENLNAMYPSDPWGERAAYDVPLTVMTQGSFSSTDKDALKIYADAIRLFEGFIKRYPRSALVVEAKFGIASCLEELERLDEAYSMYESIASTYPSPQVIAIKLARIRERRQQRGQTITVPRRTR